MKNTHLHKNKHKETSGDLFILILEIQEALKIRERNASNLLREHLNARKLSVTVILFYIYRLP